MPKLSTKLQILEAELVTLLASKGLSIKEASDVLLSAHDRVMKFKYAEVDTREQKPLSEFIHPLKP